MGDIFFEAHLWRKWMYNKLSDLGFFKGSFKEFYDLYEHFLVDVYRGKTNYDDNYVKFINHLGLTKNIDEFISESYSVKKNFETTRSLYPEVAPTLKKLSSNNIKNIVITDNEAGEKTLREKILKRFEIDEFINKIVSSKTYNITKPDPEIFSIALNLFDLKKNEVVFVGHDVDEINGATDWGIEVIEYNNYLEEATNAKYKISCFSEILNIVGEV